jgi:hypothetical protein
MTLACASDWLDCTAPPIPATMTVGNAATNTSSASVTTTNTISHGTSWYYGGYWYPYYSVISGDARPIKLKMSEVERLRKAARDDAKLKAILNKFTSQIEIAVDFD